RGVMDGMGILGTMAYLTAPAVMPDFQNRWSITPFALLGVLLLGAAGLGLRGEARTQPAPPAADTAPTPVPPDPAPVPPDPAEQAPVPPDATPLPPAVRNGADPSG
ncbi:hypothetical protein ABZ688_37060, partial [Streptomyces fimicarius]